MYYFNVELRCFENEIRILNNTVELTKLKWIEIDGFGRIIGFGIPVVTQKLKSRIANCDVSD